MGFLRQLFGTSPDEIWRQLAAELGANYDSSFWTGGKVSIEDDQWTITLDTYR